MTFEPASPAAAPARVPLRGELYLLPVSPWSHRVNLTIRHARTAVAVREFRSVLTELHVWAASGFPRGLRVTAPALRSPDAGWVMDSHAIARAVDAARAPDAPTLFPPAHDAALRRLVAHAETLQAFWRGRVVDAMRAEPQYAVNLLAPPALHWIPGLRAVAALFMANFATKYQTETDAAQEDAARVALEEIAETLRKAPVVDGVRYALGGALSYADFALALAIPLVKNEASSFKDVPVTAFEGEFPEVREYAAAMLKKHVSKEDVKFPPPLFDVDGNIV